MVLSIHPLFSFSSGTFTLFIASAGTIHKALHALLSRHRGRLLYLCGNYPVILPGLVTDQSNLQIRRALTAYQILSILEEADESLILFEHDRTLYDDNEHLLPPIGESCRQKAAGNGGLILFATHQDRWLIRIEPYVDRMAFIQEPVHQPARAGSQVHSEQLLLDRIW